MVGEAMKRKGLEPMEVAILNLEPPTFNHVWLTFEWELDAWRAWSILRRTIAYIDGKPRGGHGGYSVGLRWWIRADREFFASLETAEFG